MLKLPRGLISLSTKACTDLDRGSFLLRFELKAVKEVPSALAVLLMKLERAIIEWNSSLR